MIGGDRPPEALGHLTGFLLSWVGVRSRERFAAAMSEVGLAPQQFAAMTIIAANPGETQQSLGQATGIDPNSMVALLDGLREAGLAERRPHASDRRKHALHLTPEGEKLLGQARKVADKVGKESFGVLDSAEQSELLRLLRKLAGFEVG